MIRSIGIKNFKSIKKDVVKLPSFCAIIGRNAAGKTNLIQAIDLIKRLALGQSINRIQRCFCLVPHELFNLNESLNELLLTIHIETRQEKRYKLVIKIGLAKHKDGPSSLIIINESLKKLIQGENRKNEEALYEREGNTLKGRNGEDLPLAVEEDELALSVYREAEVIEVKSVFRDMVVVEQEIINSRKAIVNAKEDSTAALLVRLKHGSDETYKQFRKIVGKILPDFSSFVEFDTYKGNGNHDTPSEEKDILILCEEKNLKGKLSMKSISAGDLRTLYLIARAISMREGSSLIIEEIENGIHPKRLVDLLSHLETLSKRKGLQIIFTTHSPSVINNFKPSNILFVRKDAQDGTKLKLIEEYEQIGTIQKFLQKGGDLSDYIESRFS